jgi:hypothetical protein
MSINDVLVLSELEFELGLFALLHEITNVANITAMKGAKNDFFIACNPVFVK